MPEKKEPYVVSQYADDAFYADAYAIENYPLPLLRHPTAGTRKQNCVNHIFAVITDGTVEYEMETVELGWAYTVAFP